MSWNVFDEHQPSDPAEKKWGSVNFDGYTHIVPLNDITPHSYTTDCFCHPDAEVLMSDQSAEPVHTRYKHHPQDGRDEVTLITNY